MFLHYSHYSVYSKIYSTYEYTIDILTKLKSEE